MSIGSVEATFPLLRPYSRQQLLPNTVYAFFQMTHGRPMGNLKIMRKRCWVANGGDCISDPNVGSSACADAEIADGSMKRAQVSELIIIISS